MVTSSKTGYAISIRLDSLRHQRSAAYSEGRLLTPLSSLHQHPRSSAGKNLPCVQTSNNVKLLPVRFETSYADPLKYLPKKFRCHACRKVRHNALMCRSSKRAAQLISTPQPFSKPSTFQATQSVVPSAAAIIEAKVISDEMKPQKIGSSQRSRKRHCSLTELTDLRIRESQ